MKSVICAIVKDENIFIREWVEHYLKNGFQKLYIFEDFGSKSHYNELKDYIEQDKVELNSLSESHYVKHYKKGTSVQKNLYDKFLKDCKEKNLADWIGFFDIDEFIMFEDGWDLEKLEQEFDDYGGVLLSWKLYGANGHLKRPEGSVVENYTTHLPEGSLLDGESITWAVKSLVNVKNSSHQEAVIHVFSDCKLTNKLDRSSNKLSFEKAWLNHYYTKSWEDYLNRIFSRGNMANNYRCLDKFFTCNPDLKDKEKEMIFAQRKNHTASTMWISRKYRLISGGNIQRLQEIQKKLENL